MHSRVRYDKKQTSEKVQRYKQPYKILDSDWLKNPYLEPS